MTPGSPRAVREGRRFFKFTVVGVIGAVVDFGTFNILTTLVGVWSVLASMFSFSAAVTSNFFWNRFWTYPDSRSKPVRQQALQFAIVNVIGLVIRTPIFAFAEPRLIRAAGENAGALHKILALDTTVLGRNAALALAVIVVLFWNFGINRIWTYSDVL
ncbi:MAG TPA: GtrA family protein [Anaerolineales bacterium]|nr:GtrA family protein [Anaerolineales bacterium]